MEEVASDSVIGLDLSRRGLHSLAPWLSPGEGEEAPLGQLETLDASRNALTCVRGLQHLPRLRVLNLYFNRVEALAELLRLRACAGTLRVLDLRLNPVTRLEGYRRCVV
jgi:Leucine-rich repeat (LRR) protein